MWKTVSKTATHINSIEKTLKQSIEKGEFKKIKETISRNEQATKRVLKHEPDNERNQKTSQTTAMQDTLKPRQAGILKNNTNIASNSIN